MVLARAGRRRPGARASGNPLRKGIRVMFFFIFFFELGIAFRRTPVYTRRNRREPGLGQLGVPRHAMILPR